MQASAAWKSGSDLQTKSQSWNFTNEATGVFLISELFNTLIRLRSWSKIFLREIIIMKIRVQSPHTQS